MKGRFSMFVAWSKQLAACISIILMTIFCLSQNSSAQSQINESLIDLKSLKITAQLSSELIKMGLKGSDIDVDTYLRLQDIYSAEGNSNLIIFANAIKLSDNYVSYSIEVSLKQSVFLERRKTKSFYASTWTMTTMGVTNDVNDIKEAVSQMVGKFWSDYLAANPNFVSKFAINKNENSPFTATYVGGNRQPEVEIFNDTDRTLYLNFGQDTLTPYTIPPKSSKKFTLTEGIYKFKATVPRVAPISGQDTFQKGYVYTWRFVIVTQRIN